MYFFDRCLQNGVNCGKSRQKNNSRVTVLRIVEALLAANGHCLLLKQLDVTLFGPEKYNVLLKMFIQKYLMSD
jgi:hypothetical protein